MDLTYQTWETIRLTHVKVALINVDRRAALAEIFAPVGKATAQDLEYLAACDEARRLSAQYFEKENKSEVEKRLRKYGLNAGSIAAVSYARQVVTLEIIEEKLAALEIRRSRTLRELELRRERKGSLHWQGLGQLSGGVPVLSPHSEAAE